MKHNILFIFLFIFNSFSVVNSQVKEPSIFEFTNSKKDIRSNLVFNISFENIEIEINQRKFAKYLEICESKKDNLSKVRLIYLKYKHRSNFGMSEMDEEALLKEALEITNYYGYKVEELVFNHYYHYFLYHKDKKQVEEHYLYVLREFDLIKEMGFNLFTPYEIGRMLNHSGRFVYELEDFDNALRMFNLAEHYIMKDAENLSIYVRIMNNIQVIYQLKKNYTKALEYVVRIKKSTENCTEKVEFCFFWQGLSRLDMADILMNLNENTKAEQIAEEGYTFIGNRKGYNHNIEAEYDALTVLIRIKLKFKKYDEAEKLLGRQKIIFDSLSEKEDFYFKKLSFYDQSAHLAEQKKDFALAILYGNFSKPIRDSFNNRNDARKIEQLNQKHKIQTLQNNLLIVEKDKKINIWFRNAALLLLLFGASLFYIRYLTLRNREREKEKLLESAKTSLKVLTENLQKKAHLLEQLSSEIAAVQTDLNRQSIMDTLHQHTILKDEDWHEFKALFEKVHPNYINELKELYLDITPAEIRILVLEKLNFSLQAMANTLGVGKSTIHQTKYRLKKKLQAQNNSVLE